MARAPWDRNFIVVGGWGAPLFPSRLRGIFGHLRSASRLETGTLSIPWLPRAKALVSQRPAQGLCIFFLFSFFSFFFLLDFFKYSKALAFY